MLPPAPSGLAIRPQIRGRAGNSTARWVHSQHPGLCNSSQKLGRMIGAPVGAAICSGYAWIVNRGSSKTRNSCPLRRT